MRTRADYSGALRLLRKRARDPKGFPKAMLVSALQEDGLADAWQEMQALVQWRRDNGFFDSARAAQAEYWFAEEVRQGVLRRLESGAAKEVMAELGTAVAKGEITAALAAKEALSRIGEA
jgi:LAO/AO transport system kinase